jgi:hypothetical protein
VKLLTHADALREEIARLTQITNEDAWYRTKLQAENAKLKADNKALLDAAKAARLHLADYSRRSMFGTDCDDDVRKAQDILRAAIEHSEPQ